MKMLLNRRLFVVALFAGLLAASAVTMAAESRAERTARSKKAVALFQEADDSLEATLAKASGYAVFPTVGKGGIGLGGARGSGQLFEKGVPVGDVTMTQVSVGLQLGGQAYAELVIFENDDVLEDFKRGNFEFSAQASAVAAASGASANAKFEHGVKIVTLAKKGLMYEASVGGQKFGYRSYK